MAAAKGKQRFAIAATRNPPKLKLLRSLCRFDLLLLLCSQYLSLRSEPVVQGEPVNRSALLVQLGGALTDAFCNVV